ncbi:Fic family protein [Mumia sp. zg.B21]|uniref:Fic family protein n=1 Tax=Mumia sp. zg.B21 TaxID=2855447 RepID=UPI001C6DE918|nr:Fic family protein [Mumia sp. zg.B21]MBW9210161.1 Fic family protein [Mumia sp. zg.B21]
MSLDAGPGRYLSSLAEFLTRTESVASSRIERVYADLDDLARASLGEESTRSATSTLAATLALRELTESCDDGAPLSEGAILSAHAALLADDLLEHRAAGSYRTQQNWIGGSDFTPRNAAHVPPPPEVVQDLMSDLVDFANRDDLSPVAQAAVAHGQFEAIHPFNDGNGRIGRGLISAVFRRRGTTRRTVVPIAAVMLADVDTYFDRLADYRAGDVEPLVRYVASAAMTATEAAEASAERLAALPSLWEERVGTRRGSAAQALVGTLLEHPIVDIAAVEAITGASRARSYDAIDAVEDAGILHEITGRSRNRIWVAADVMDEIAALEERIGARTRPSARWR